jgi:hypothetical protein
MEQQFLKNYKRFHLNHVRGIMLYEMFPQENMDRFLKLKLDLAYKDLPIEVAEQRFKDLSVKQEEGVPPLPVRRKVRIPKKK